MSHPFHTNVSALKTQLGWLKMQSTTTGRKINLNGMEDNKSRLRLAILKVEQAIEELKKIEIG